MGNREQGDSRILCSLEYFTLHINTDSTCTLIQQSVFRPKKTGTGVRTNLRHIVMILHTALTADVVLVVEHTSHAHPLLLSPWQHILPVHLCFPTCKNKQKSLNIFIYSVLMLNNNTYSCGCYVSLRTFFIWIRKLHCEKDGFELVGKNIQNLVSDVCFFSFALQLLG